MTLMINGIPSEIPADVVNGIADLPAEGGMPFDTSDLAAGEYIIGVNCDDGDFSGGVWVFSLAPDLGRFGASDVTLLAATLGLGLTAAGSAIVFAAHRRPDAI